MQKHGKCAFSRGSAPPAALGSWCPASASAAPPAGPRTRTAPAAGPCEELTTPYFQSTSAAYQPFGLPENSGSASVHRDALRTRRPDCPENSVSVLLCSSALTDSPPGFPASNLGGLGRRLRCRAGAAGRLCQAGMWLARRWASPYSLGTKRGWASQYSLGEPVLIGRARTHWASQHWASPYSLGEPVLGEPSNEVGASHQTRLGEPVLRGRWASHSTFTAASTPASKLRLLGAVPRVPARHV